MKKIKKAITIILAAAIMTTISITSFTSLAFADELSPETSISTEVDQQTVDKVAETTENTEESKCVPYVNEKGQTVYTGKYATAYVEKNGCSGYIDITDTNIWDTKDGLTEIGGYQLSHIIRFGNTGFVSNVHIAMDDGGTFFKNRIFATGQDSGSSQYDRSFIYFTDETNDEYSLMIESTRLKTHYVDYNSDKPRLKKIRWATDDYENPKEILYDFDSVKDWPVPAYGTFYEKENGWKIYKDEYATAIVPPECKTASSFAHLRITDTSIWKNGNELTNINGVPLKDITSQGSGHISSIKTVHDGGIIYDNTLTVKGAKESLWSDHDYQAYFMDATGDEYSLLILDSSEKNHTVWYNSDHPEIVEVRWEIYKPFR